MTAMPVADVEQYCSVCGGGQITTLRRFESLHQVTSDCRPFAPGGRLGICTECGAVQKPADATWKANAALIYGRYEMFRQAAGRAEQAVFEETATAPVRRSAMLLGKLNEVWPFSERGRALDVGCGNGPTLRALSELAPGWDLYGHELSDANADMLAAIRGFRRLYVGDVEDIDDRFDLVALSQTLEHLTDPVESLATLRSKLKPGGILFVQVPNARLNVFDLVVADHRTHFDPGTLATAARRAGFKHVAVNEWVYKELSMTASDTPLSFPSLPEARRMTIEELSARIDWIAAVAQAACDIAQSCDRFGIFGSSIAATWLFGSMPDQVSFFVDEDPSRAGHQHEGRPILSPGQIPDGATVFIPLVPQMAENIAARLKSQGIDARVPPRQIGF